MLTVHAAKGLEFPIVILANLAAGRSRAETWLADRTAGRVEFRMGEQESGWRTAGFEAAAAREERHAAAEARRLLYVACTRARDHLVLPLVSGTDGSLVACLAGQLPSPQEATGGAVVVDQFILDAATLAPPPDDLPARTIRLDGDPTAGLMARAAWAASRGPAV